MFTGAELLVECLFRRGVRLIFGMPGSHSTHIYDAIHRHGGIQTILCRNEQAGAYMADGYARATGIPGVICTTAGPGATNALSGIAEAYADSVPVLLITGQVNHDRLHEECGRYHEIDLEGIFRPCTRYAGTVMSNDRIPAMVEQAFHAMTAGRPGPATLILPQDLMAVEARSLSAMSIGHVRGFDDLAIASDKSATCPTGTIHAAFRLAPSMDAIREAAKVLHAARRPIILAGGGAVWSEAGDEIKGLAKRLDCPVVTTLNGKGIVDERDPISFGHGRSIRGRGVLPHADAMLAIGCRFTEVFTWFGKMPVPKALVQIDIDPGQIGMNYPVAVGIHADAKTALRALLNETSLSVSDWEELRLIARGMNHPKPEWFVEVLRAELPDDALVVTDASEMAIRIQTDFPAYAPRTVLYPSNYIALGWGLPAAVGAAVALPDRRIVSVSGDGGFLMSAQELATAMRYRLKLVAVVHNDSAYGAIRNLQRIKHESRFQDTDLNNPDFVKFAESFGVPACRAKNAAEFAQALRDAQKREGPSLIEVPDQWRSLRVHP